MSHQAPTASPTSLDHSICQMLAEAQTAQTCRNDLTWEVPQLHTLCGWTAGKRQPWHTDLGNTAAWQRLPRPTATHYSQLKGGKKGRGYIKGGTLELKTLFHHSSRQNNQAPLQMLCSPSASTPSPHPYSETGLFFDLLYQHERQSSGDTSEWELTATARPCMPSAEGTV